MHLRDYNGDMDSELLYIGQSFGANGERKSPDRLKSYSTLQNIYSEAIQTNPDKEIWAVFIRDVTCNTEKTNL